MFAFLRSCVVIVIKFYIGMFLLISALGLVGVIFTVFAF